MQPRAQQLSVRRGRHAERAASERRKQIAHDLKCPSALLQPHWLAAPVSLPVFPRVFARRRRLLNTSTRSQRLGSCAHTHTHKKWSMCAGHKLHCGRTEGRNECVRCSRCIYIGVSGHQRVPRRWKSDLPFAGGQPRLRSQHVQQ